MLPFDSPWAIPYCWSFETECLSLAVFEIFSAESDVMNGSHDPKRPQNKGQGHSIWCPLISTIRFPIGRQ